MTNNKNKKKEMSIGETNEILEYAFFVFSVHPQSSYQTNTHTHTHTHTAAVEKVSPKREERKKKKNRQHKKKGSSKSSLSFC